MCEGSLSAPVPERTTDLAANRVRLERVDRLLMSRGGKLTRPQKRCPWLEAKPGAQVLLIVLGNLDSC